MTDNPLKIIFFGTPEFAVESLDRIRKAGHYVCAVVTMPDKTGNRGHGIIESDVKKYAVKNGIPLLQPEKLRDENFLNALRKYDADIFIVIAFRMMPEVVWNMPRLGTFNLHASLLPRYRGAAPLNRAIMNGETKTGVTTFFLKHEIDTGDIIEQREIDILPDDNVGTIHDKLMALGADMVVDNLENIADGTVRPKPQPDGDFIPAPKIFARDMTIDWNRTAVEIHNQVRGLSPYPAARAVMLLENDRDMNVKIYETSLNGPDNTLTLRPGEIFTTKHSLFVGTATTPIEVLSLQPAGKKRMDTSSFLLGYKPQYAK